MTEPAPPPGDRAPGAIACPRCGAGVAPEQEWCLECGYAARTRVVTARRWRLPVALVALVLLLAAVGLALAFVEITADPPGPAPTVADPGATTVANPGATTAAPAP